MATAAEIRDRAANDLGVLRLGQSLQSQDETRIESAYSEVYAALKVEGVATWAYSGEVPDEIVQHVASLVAENCLNTYGVSQERSQRIKDAASVAIKEIRRLTAPSYVSADTAVDY